MLSPAAYRLAYWDDSCPRCEPVMREPLTNTLATATSWVCFSSCCGDESSAVLASDNDQPNQDHGFRECFWQLFERMPSSRHPKISRNGPAGPRACTNYTLKPRARSWSRPSSVIISRPQGGIQTQLIR